METNNSERIERFLREQMTQEESRKFLSDLKTNKELREEAQMMALLIKDIKEGQAKQDAGIIEEVLAQKKRVRIIRLTKWIGSIAAMFILVLGGTFLLNRPSETDKIFQAYYAPYTITSSKGGDDEAIKEELATLYNKLGTEKDVSPIIDRLQTIYDNIQSNNEDFIDYDDYENDIAWYLTLAYIKDHKLDKAKELLKPMADDGVTEAEGLLKKLTNL